MNPLFPEIVFSERVRAVDRDAVHTYIHRLESKGLPAILSVPHLSAILSIKEDELFAISNAQGRFYRDFKVRKKEWRFT